MDNLALRTPHRITDLLLGKEIHQQIFHIPQLNLQPFDQ